MATTKISSTKSTSRAINYAEKRAVEKSGHNCDIHFAKSAFKYTREAYGKTGGNQGHVVIQSFKPDEVTPEQCNELGLELAEKIAPNHQVAVYTHDDTDHVHNHIVINSIDMETGKKFNNNKKAMYDVRKANDEVCSAHGLSIPEKKASMRYTQAEKSLLEKGQSSWKDEIREAIEQSQATNFKELEQDLSESNISIERITQKTITYKHLGENKKVRGEKLGDDYDKEGLEHGFERQIWFNEQRKREDEEREREQQRYDELNKSLNEYTRNRPEAQRTREEPETEPRKQPTNHRPIKKFGRESEKDDLELG